MTDATLTGDWTIDPAHSRIGFSTRHAMVTKVRGAFNDVAGDITFAEDGSEGSHASVTVQMNSIDTRNQQRDDHLRTLDFFHTEQYPEMTFVSSSIEEVDDDGYIVSGDLTIMDTTRNVAIPLRFMGVNTDPFGVVRAGFEGTRRLDRRDWGITYNAPLANGGLLIGDRIQLEFELSLIKVDPQADEADEQADGNSQPDDDAAAQPADGAADPEGIIDAVPTGDQQEDASAPRTENGS